MKRIFYLLVFLSLLFTAQKTMAQFDGTALTGGYHVTGYCFTYNTSFAIDEYGARITYLGTAPGYPGYAANEGGSPNFYFSLDTANKTYGWQPAPKDFYDVYSFPKPPASGFLYQDTVTPKIGYYPVNSTEFTSDVYNNRYDSVTKTFWFHFGGSESDYDTGVAAYTREYYVKWEWVPPPVVTSYSPTVGKVGTMVTIKGSHLTPMKFAYFNQTRIGYNSISDSALIVFLPNGPATGQISIETFAGLTTLPDSFTVVPVTEDHSTWDTVGTPNPAVRNAQAISMTTNSAGTPYLVFADGANGGKATVMKLAADSSWQVVGGAVSSAATGNCAIAIGTDDVPLIAYRDSGYNTFSVHKFTGGAWQQLPGVSSALTYPGYTHLSLILDNTNTPYVLSSNLVSSNLSYLHVQKYTGNGWIAIGEQSGTTTLASGTGNGKLALDKAGNIYVFTDDPTTHGAIIRKFDGAKWSILGSVNFSHTLSGIYYPDIKINSSGKPVVAFADDNVSSDEASVFEYNGTDWVLNGFARFSTRNGDGERLELSPLDKPYVILNQVLNDYKTSVMTPNPNNDGSWQYVGKEGLIADGYYTNSAITISKAGVLYAAFSDLNNNGIVTVIRNGTAQPLLPRLNSGLYTIGDSTTCEPWYQNGAGWTDLISNQNNVQSLELQTQFQDEPGNLCGFQSYIDSSAIYRKQRMGDAAVVLSPRNYRIQFSDSNFTYPVGIRLFGKTDEINELLNQASANHAFSVSDIKVVRYDGPNEDYLPENNANGTTVYNDTSHGAYTDYSYTFIQPIIHYYGANNEYYYLEFYTDHFSEFYTGIPTAYVLPVNLLSFTASAHDKTASLYWQTNNEVNTSSFTIQRSTDGVHFTGIGNVIAAGGSSTHSYNYRDDLSGIAASTVYYRLVITDKDGRSKQSGIASVSLAQNKLITLQPNPAHNYVVVACNEPGRKTIFITDMNGKKVFVKTTANNSETVNVRSFAKGLYLVRIDYLGGSATKKLVVE